MAKNWVAILIFLLSGSPQGLANESEALQRMTRMQQLLRSDTNIARYSVRIVTADWQRTVRFESWDDRAGNRSFVRITAPVKEKDTTYLKRDGGLWMFLPKLERHVRIPPSMMLSSWMGSSLTYDDLIKAASVIEDYVHRIVARDETTITIESIPKPEAPVVWGRLVFVLTKDSLPVSEDFYDEKGRKRRTLKFEDVREFDQRQIPARMVMRPLDDSGKKTILQLEAMEFDPLIADSVFTQANMRFRGD